MGHGLADFGVPVGPVPGFQQRRVVKLEAVVEVECGDVLAERAERLHPAVVDVADGELRSGVAYEPAHQFTVQASSMVASGKSAGCHSCPHDHQPAGVAYTACGPGRSTPSSTSVGQSSDLE